LLRHETVEFIAHFLDATISKVHVWETQLH
jgi:hypothetical protein